MSAPVDLNWNAVYSFWLVARHGSFAEAARMMPHGSAQSMHKRVRELEKSNNLNLRLLRSRGMRGVEPTEAGRRIFQLVDPVFRSISVVAGELREEESGHLDLAFTGFASHHYGTDLVQRFHRTYPKTRLRVRIHSSEKVISLVESGEADFGICGSPEGQRHLTIAAQKTIRCKILLPRNHPLAGKLVTWPELARYPLVLTNRQGALRKTLDQVLTQNELSLEVNVSAELATSELAVEAVRAGLGVGILAVGPRLTKHLRGLACAELPPGFPTLTLAVICRKNRYLPRYMRGFVKIASRVIRSETSILPIKVPVAPYTVGSNGETGWPERPLR